MNRSGRSPAIRRRPAVPRAGAGGGAALRAGPAPCSGDHGDLPAARRHPAGDRAGGGALRRAGIEELAARLDNRFHLLTGGRRTALPRHQTLRATLDWSYERLPEPERVLLRHLAVFAGVFSLEAVAASPEFAPSEVIDGLANLVAKSLVAAEAQGKIARYRLLDMTRAYALQKLGESSKCERLARATPSFTALCSSGRWPLSGSEQTGTRAGK